MGKRLKSIANDASEFKNGIETRLVIPDTTNIKGQLWLYVNRHPDNKELIRVLFKMHPHPFIYSGGFVPKGRKAKAQAFGYEFVFKQINATLKKLRKHGFKVQ